MLRIMKEYVSRQSTLIIDNPLHWVSCLNYLRYIQYAKIYTVKRTYKSFFSSFFCCFHPTVRFEYPAIEVLVKPLIEAVAEGPVFRKGDRYVESKSDGALGIRRKGKLIGLSSNANKTYKREKLRALGGDPVTICAILLIIKHGASGYCESPVFLTEANILKLKIAINQLELGALNWFHFDLILTGDLEVGENEFDLIESLADAFSQLVESAQYNRLSIF